MFQLAGTGASAARLRLVFGEDIAVRVKVEDVEHSFTAVTSYVHMGTSVNPAASMAHEAARRAAAMHVHFGPARKRVYANPRMGRAPKMVFAESLAFSRLFFGVGPWGTLRDTEAARMRGAYLSLLRVVTRKVQSPGVEQRYTNDQVAADADVLSFDARLALHRARYAVRLMRHAPGHAVRLVVLAHEGPRSWSKALARDLSLLQSHGGGFDDMPDPRADLCAWLLAFRSDPDKWRSAVKRGFARMRGAPAVVATATPAPAPPPRRLGWWSVPAVRAPV